MCFCHIKHWSSLEDLHGVDWDILPVRTSVREVIHGDRIKPLTNWGTMIMPVHNFIPTHLIIVDIIQSGSTEVEPPADQQHHP